MCWSGTFCKYSSGSAITPVSSRWSFVTVCCQQGATEYPYHADGQLCRLYSAADIIAIGDAATAHKLYHTTYCNHLLTWARRAEAADKLSDIVYGAELPGDLAANMVKVLGGAT